MNDECLICGRPLEYLKTDVVMECAVCHKQETSRIKCVSGHYVCNECHVRGMDSIVGVCMNETTDDPVAVLEKLMSLPFCHMHGPEHHVIVGAALLTAYRNAGGRIDLKLALLEMMQRGKQIPGGVCGFWGACGAGISTGIFVSIIFGSTPLAGRSWGLSNLMTSSALDKIGSVGGPRCCKRDSYLAVLAAVDFVRDNFGISMRKSEVKCSRWEQNNQCIKGRCPFSKHCQ